jgi:hypothetical protein
VSHRRPQGPGDPFESIVAGLWPQLGDDDPRQYDMDKAYQEVVTDIRLNFGTIEWEAIPPDVTRPLLRITCEPSLHFRGGAPMLAEVWKTSRGLLYASRLPLAFSDPDNDPDDPFAPPTAVLSEGDRLRRARAQSKRPSGPGWEPVPITIVRVPLHDPVMARARLWIKCAQHFVGEVDIVKLLKVYKLDQERRRAHDTPEATVIYLHNVVALSSDL